MQVIVAQCLTHDAVLDKLHSYASQIINFGIDHRIGQAEFRNTVFEHTAYLMQRLIDRDGKTAAAPCRRQTTGRPAPEPTTATLIPLDVATPAVTRSPDTRSITDCP